MNNTPLQKQAMFVSFCIEQYAKAKSLPPEHVADLLKQYGIAQHFCEFYDILHTHSAQWLIEEIDNMLNERKQ